MLLGPSYKWQSICCRYLVRSYQYGCVSFGPAETRISGPQYLIPRLSIVCMGVIITKMVTRSSTPLCSLRIYPWFRPYSRLTLQCQRRVHKYYFNQVFNTTYLQYIQLRHIMSTVCGRCDGGVCRSTFSLHAIPLWQLFDAHSWSSPGNIATTNEADARRT